MKEITVSCVKLDDLETGRQRSHCGIPERNLRLSNLFKRHLPRRRMIFAECNWARSEDLSPSTFFDWNQSCVFPGRRHAGLSAGMPELNTCRGALGMDERNDLGEPIDVGIIPEAEVARRDSALWKNGGCLSKYESRTADGASREMDEVPIVHEAVLCGVLAHRRYRDAVR